MATTKVGIVYSLALKSRRCVVVPDSDAELPLKIQPGEGYVEQPIEDYQKRGPDIFLAEQLGPALSDICAAVDKSGAVVGLFHGDPAIYEPPGHSFVLSDIAVTGDQFDGKAFLRRFVLTDATGKVASVVTADATTPPQPDPGGAVMASLSLTVGDQAMTPAAADADVVA